MSWFFRRITIDIKSNGNTFLALTLCDVRGHMISSHQKKNDSSRAVIAHVHFVTNTNGDGASGISDAHTDSEVTLRVSLALTQALPK